MDKHKFTISIPGSQREAETKAKGVAIIAAHLSAETITALAHVIQTDPGKVALAKQFLGVA